MILRTAIFAAAAIALLQMGALAQSGKTQSYPAAAAAKKRAGKIPIVATNSGDPVATGLAASLARPGGNFTGVSNVVSELSAKRLALFRRRCRMSARSRWRGTPTIWA